MHRSLLCNTHAPALIRSSSRAGTVDRQGNLGIKEEGAGPLEDAMLCSALFPCMHALHSCCRPHMMAGCACAVPFSSVCDASMCASTQ